MNYYYLILNIASIVFPFVLSFDKNVRYVQKWRYAIISILFTSLIFIPWDAYFTSIGVWGFNEQYLTGIHFFGLPMEENLFFITVPFACIFVMECVRYYLPKLVSYVDVKLNWVLLIVFNALTIWLIVLYWGRWYSMSAMIGALVAVNLCSFLVRNYIALALVSYAFICIPFLIINGALTGAFSDAPVVWYNPQEFSGIRVWTIPMEDFYYNLLMVISLFFFYFAWQKLILRRKVL